MIEYGFWSLIPPFLAIFLAIFTGEVAPSLLFGIFVGYLILQSGDGLQALLATLDALVNIFAEAWVVKTIFFSFLVGAFLVLVQASGGVQGLIDALTKKKQWIRSKKSSLLLAYGIGIVVFIESSITILLSGAIARPLTEKFKVSKAKLAYVCDSTSAPICGLIPLNAWGATIMGAIAAQVQKGLIDVNPVELLIQSLPYQLYSFSALLLVFFVILSGRDIGLMKKLEQEASLPQSTPEEKSFAVDLDVPVHPKANANFWHLLFPVFVLIGMIPFALWVTGQGNMMQGSGSTAVFWAVCAALMSMAIYYVTIKKIFSLHHFMAYVYKGVANMVPIASILIFAFAMGHVLGQLETGKYLASFMGNHLSAATLPAFIFVLSGIMAFATGTSFGTFSIMIPIGLQMGVPLEASLPLVLGAVISGGIFGDHCSPISDTTIMASMVSGCNHIDHVKSQMPYAFISAIIAFFGFLLLGFGL